jgi:osmoprotectant transport system substrate-binding protein
MLRLRTRAGLVAGALVASLGLVACGAEQGGEDAFSSGEGGGDTIVVGSANFPESELLMQMYAQALEDAGVAVETRPNIGAREVYMKAFEDGDIDLLPEYNGALLAYLMAPETVPQDVTSPDDVYAELQDHLPEGSETLDQAAAEDKDTLTVSRETAEEHDLQTMEDIAPVAGELSLAAGPEFRERYQGLVGLKEVYGIEFGEYKPLDAGGPLTTGALEAGDVDVANIFSTSSAIETNDWVVLEDTKNLFLAENIVPLVRSDAVTPEVEEALDAVSAALTTDNLTEALARVQVDKQDPAVVAEEFLTAEGVLD